MAVSNQTVVVTVVVKGGNSSQVLNQLGLGTQNAGNQANKAASAFAKLNSVLQTMGKALLSTVAVLVAFNLFVTLPQMIAKGLLAVMEVAIKVTDEIQRATISTAGLFMTVMDYGKMGSEGFKLAYNEASRFNYKLVELSGRALASFDDMQQAAQMFFARGGRSFVKSTDEAAEAIQRLTDLTIMYAGTTNKSRQIQSEIPAMLEGRMQGATIAKLIRGVVGDFDAWLKKTREQKNLLQELDRIFPGLAEASKELAKTPTGLLNSIKGMASYLTSITMTHGAFKEIVKYLDQIRSGLQRTMSELTNWNTATNETKMIVDAFLNMSVSMQELMKQFNAFIMAITNSSSTLESLVKINNLVSGGIMLMATSFEYFTHKVNIGLAVIKALKEGNISAAQSLSMFGAAINFPMLMQKNFDAMAKGKENIFKAMQDALNGKGSGTAKDLPVIDPEAEKNLEHVTDLLRKLKEESELAAVSGGKLLSTQIKNDYEWEKTISQLQKYKATQEQINAATKMLGIKAFFAEMKAFHDDVEGLNEDLYKFMQGNLSRGMEKDKQAMEQANSLLDRYIEDIIAIEGREDPFARVEMSIASASIELTAFLDRLGKAMPTLRKELVDSFVRWADTLRKDAAFKTLIENNKQYVDEVAATMQNTRDLANEFDYLQSKGESAAAEMERLRLEMRGLASLSSDVDDKIATLQGALAGADPKQRTVIEDQLRQLAQVKKQLRDTVRGIDDQLVNSANEMDLWAIRVDRGWKAAAKGALSFGQSVKLAAGTVALKALQNLGQFFQDMFTSMFEGEGALKAIRKFLGNMVMAVGQALVATGVANVASGMSPWTAYLIPIGLKQIAVGAATIAAGVALAGTGGGAGGKGASSASSTESRNQTIYMQPYFQRNNNTLDRLNATLDRLDGSIGSLETQSPGVIVKNGAGSPGAGQALAKSVNTALKTNTSLRVDMGKTVMGEGF